MRGSTGELMTKKKKKKKETSDKSQATQPFYCSNGAHSYGYLMAAFRYIYFFLLALSSIFRSTPWFISELFAVVVVMSCFILSLLFRYLLLLFFSFRLNAIIYLNGRASWRCEMTGNGHDHLMCVLGPDHFCLYTHKNANANTKQWK